MYSLALCDRPLNIRAGLCDKYVFVPSRSVECPHFAAHNPRQVGWLWICQEKRHKNIRNMSKAHF